MKPFSSIVLVVSASALISCGYRERPFNSNVNNATGTGTAAVQIDNDIAQCYSATPLQISIPSSPLAKVNRICLKNNDSNKQSWTFEFFVDSKLVERHLSTVSPVQPVCLSQGHTVKCYNFTASNGDFFFRNKSSKERELTFKDSRDPAEFVWSLRPENQSSGTNRNVNEEILKNVVRCYEAIPLLISGETSKLSGTNQICVKAESEQLGMWSFEFYAAGELLVNMQATTSKIQPRCFQANGSLQPYSCYNFSSAAGTLFWANDLSMIRLSFEGSPEISRYEWHLKYVMVE
jgi:hypothetical protein